MTAPRFSVVIPTCDRPHLVAGAVRTALGQTFGDLEVIVSDNGAGDGLAPVLARFTDPRVRSVRTTGRLLMHDSWAFALEQARGRAVAFLCDDDAIHPRALTIADRVLERTGAEVAVWRSCTYEDAGWRGAESRFVFGRPYTDRVYEIDGPTLLDDAFAMRVTQTDLVPKMLNCVVRRELLERIEAAGAPLFVPSCPDYSAMAVLAAYSRRTVLLDAPLLIVGATADSIGAGTLRRTEVSRRFIDDLNRRAPDILMPHPPMTPSVWIAQTLMQCAAGVPALRGRRIDEVNTYGLAGVEIERWRAGGVPVDDVDQELARTLAGPLADHADAVRCLIAERRGIESERFVRSLEPPGDVLGIGPFFADATAAAAAGFDSMATLAEGLDAWLDRQAFALDRLWDAAAERAGASRAVVLYGLGANGRTLARMTPPAGHRLAGRLLGVDDRADLTPDGLSRLDSAAELSPARHFVIVTPWNGRSIAARLVEQGFRPGEDFGDLRALTCGAGTPSGCT